MACTDCNGADSGFNPRVNLTPIDEGFDMDNLIVRGKDGSAIVFTKIVQGDKIIWEGDYVPYAAPTTSLSVSPATAEIGQSVDATFTGSFVEGSEDIVTMTLSPEPDPLPDMDESPFNWTVNGITSNVPGTIGTRTFTVVDGAETSVARTAGVSFRHRYFQGFHTSASINSAQMVAMTGALGTSARSLYSGTRDYVIPDTDENYYVYWCIPTSDTAAIGAPTMGGFPFPLTLVGTVTRVANDYGVQVVYNIYRSTNSFGATTLSITIPS